MNRIIEYLRENNGASLWQIYSAINSHPLIDLSKITNWIEEAINKGAVHVEYDELNLANYYLTNK